MHLELSKMILATGAVGTAAFGIVETLKWTRIGIWGFSKIPATLGPEVMAALKVAYGNDHEELLKAQYRGKRGSDVIGKTLRQGIRIGLGPSNAEALANRVGVVDGEQLKETAEKIQNGESLDPELRAVLGRFELAIDARIDAALVLAESSYKAGLRSWASVAAMIISILGALALHLGEQAKFSDLIFPSLIVGIAAVPLAPIAKDVVAGIRSFGDAIGKKKAGS